MTGRINRCSHCGCDEPILGLDDKLYCNNCGMSLESTLPSHAHAQASKLEGGLIMSKYKCEFKITKSYKFNVVADDIQEAESQAKKQAAEKLNADEYISGFSIEWNPEQEG